MYSTNSFNPGHSGGYLDPSKTIKIPGSNYFSPWDIWFNRNNYGFQPIYKFANGNSDPEAQSNSPYVLQVTPFVGLAYYDGFNDGFFEDYHTTQTYDLSLFPNLYVNSQEVGNLVQAQTFFIQQNEMFHFGDKEDHLPDATSNTLAIPGVDLQPGVQSGSFDLNNGILSQPEIEFLKLYGKVFFYAVRVLENGVGVGDFLMHPEIDFGSGTSFFSANDNFSNPAVQLFGTAPNGTTYPLFYVTDNTHITLGSPISSNYQGYHNASDNHCNAYEVVFNLGGIPMHRYPITAGSVPMTISLDMVQNPQHSWRSSSLDLTVN